MSVLSINNVVTVSVATSPTGLADYSVNNLAIFTKEAPVNVAITATAPGVYLDATSVSTDWGSGSEVFAMANLIFSQQPNILTGEGALIIFPMAAPNTLAVSVPAGLDIQFFGGFCWAGYAPNDGEILAAAAVVQPLRCLMAVPSNLTASLGGGALFGTIQSSGFSQSRGLLYTVSAASARLYAAAYFGRLMSTAFSGSNTAATMHLKNLVGVTADPGISQSTLNTCKTIGADPYTTYPLPAVFSTGGNGYVDDVYNTNWLVSSLKVAGYNALRTTSTKLPQTETGVAVLRGAYLNVLKQSVTNGFIAPGQWNGAFPFGDPESFQTNINQTGYYIFSQPVAAQSQTDRVARKAPLIQIAVKFSGAVQSSNVIVNVEA
jgi:hypothetical protein